MSPSAQLTSEQLKEIIEDEKNTAKGAREVQGEVEDGEEVLDPANASWALNIVLSTINVEFEHQCLDERARLLNAHPVCLSTDDRVPGHKYSIPGPPGTQVLAHQVWAIQIIVRRSVWNDGMPGALVADIMGLGKTVTSVVAAIIHKLMTQKVVMRLPLSIWWGNTHEEWLILADDNFPSTVGEERGWDPFQRLNSVPRRLLVIQTTPPYTHPAHEPALEAIMLVTMPRVAETFKTVIEKMMHGINFNLVTLMHAKNANLTHQDLNTTFDEPEMRWNIHIVPYDTLTCRGKPSSNSQLPYCALMCWICDESHQDKFRNSVRWQIAMNAQIGFKLQVTAILGFHSLCDWCYQTMSLFLGVPDDPADDTVMEKHGADALYSAVKSLMDAIRTEDEEAEQDAAYQMIQIATQGMIQRWLESKLANRYPLVRIPMDNEHGSHHAWTEDKQAKLKSLVEGYTSRGASGARRIDWWQLASRSSMLGDTEDRKDVCGQWYD